MDVGEDGHVWPEGTPLEPLDACAESERAEGVALLGGGGAAGSSASCARE